MHAHNVAGKLIGTMSLFAALRCFVVQARADTDTLPFLIGECCGVLSSKPLIFIHDGSSIISWLVGRIKLTARDGVNGVDGKEPVSKAFAPCAVACGVHRIGYVLG